ncbi:alpha/beta fold hydrolase [Amycolatopsis methanolica]|uniref:Hydrolase or acyltransferase n=1 Tax=Amycolatopsis methanolica 239 TaxID=1068978 RepID=A0A076MS71_AMYME|nr:alpha/beta hydrolase [Amycolatopsis methanolica]AIJ23723.1 hydrolase or acyltransferase [Amycolatopsis methanolica 239]
MTSTAPAGITHGQTTSADGTALGYFRRGSGPALVITHGSISTSDQWIPATEHLAGHFTCYVHDRRGRGRSGDTAAYDLAAEVADIAAMMAIAGPGAHLLGHSYGALCTLAYAETHGVDGTLLLFEPPLAVDGPVAGAGLATYRTLVEAGDLEAALEFALVNFVRVPAEAVPEIRRTPLWESAVPLTPSWVRELEQIDSLGDDLTHYGAITTPVHLIAGTATTPFLFESAHALTGVLPRSGITELPGLDHFAHLVDPVGFAAVVRGAIGR